MYYFTEGYIKPKWKNLRDVFRREHAKVLEHGKRGTKWQYYKPLLFLNEGAEREIDEDDNNESENYTYTPEQDDENDKSNDNDPINNDTMQSACIKIEQDHDQYFEVVENEVVVPKKRKYIRRESDDTDYDLLYLKSLVPYFKQLEPMRKLIVRSRIQDILMNEIARSSASSNSRVESSSSSYK